MTLSQEKLDYLIAEAEKRGELRERERCAQKFRNWADSALAAGKPEYAAIYESIADKLGDQ